MKPILIVLIVSLAIAVSGMGMLANEISLDAQELGVFPGTISFDGGFSCLCNGGECSFDEGSPGDLLCGWEITKSEYILHSYDGDDDDGKDDDDDDGKDDDDDDGRDDDDDDG